MKFTNFSYLLVAHVVRREEQAMLRDSGIWAACYEVLHQDFSDAFP